MDEEREESVTVNFIDPTTGKTYSNKNLDGIPCHICGRLVKEHSSEEVHECAHKQQEQRAMNGR